MVPQEARWLAGITCGSLNDRGTCQLSSVVDLVRHEVLIRRTAADDLIGYCGPVPSKDDAFQAA